MKAQNYFLFFIFFVLSTSVATQTSWTRLTPIPQESTINCITKIPGTSRLIAVGEGSTVMMSYDVGESWEIITNPAGMNNDYLCKGINFINEYTGFINGGNETILKTTDGGFTWNLKYMGSSIYEWQCINDIKFLDETTGYAIGDNGQLFKTSDAGETWTLTESGVSFDLKNIAFANPQTGFITGNTTTSLLKTQDGGDTWIVINYPDYLPNAYLEEIYFVNETTGFIFTREYPNYVGLIFKTIDSGETWIEVYSDPWLFSSKFAFFDDLHGIAGGSSLMYSSKILQTSDGGNNWSETSLPGFSWYGSNSLCYFDQNNAFSAGMHGRIYKSSNGGTIWEEKFQRTFWGDIYGFQFLNENDAFALAENWTGGLLMSDFMKTTDGGITWEQVGVIMNNSGAFYFINPNYGFLAFNSFPLSLRKTTNGGADWTLIETGFDFDPWCIRFYDQINGIIGGEGHLIKSSDAGDTWEEISTGGGDWDWYYDIEYRSAEIIFIAGQSNYGITTLVKSIDGGETWVFDSIGNFGAARDIFFVDDNTAYLACFENTILKSVDGGETWTETTLNNPNYIQFKSIYFPSESIGYVVGDGEYETILKTIDGGETWNPINSMTTSGLNCIHFFDDNTGLVFGDGGVVMKTTSGGITGFDETGFLNSSVTFEAYPNPFRNEVNIRLKNQNIEMPAQIIIHDLTGRLIRSVQINSSSENLAIPAEDLKPGIYFYQLKTENGISETKKMIKL